MRLSNISSDLGFGVGTDDTTTGTTMVVDIDDDGTADSVLNLNDDPNFETFFDPFGNVVGNDDSFGAAVILGSGLSSNLNNLQQDVMNYNNQNNNQNTTQPQVQQIQTLHHLVNQVSIRIKQECLMVQNIFGTE